MNPKNSSKLFFGLAAVVFLLGAAAIYTKLGSNSELADQVAAVQLKVDDAAGVTSELQQSDQRIKDLKIKLEHLERGVPSYAYVPTMLKELERYGTANGVEVIGVRPVVSAPTTKPDDPAAPPQRSYDELTIEVKGRATFGDILRFTKALQQFPKVVATRTISMNPKQSSLVTSESPLLDVTFELKVFVFAQEAEAAEDEEAPIEDTSMANGSSVQKEVAHANG